MNQDNIRSVTLRVAIFFGLTTFTLCIAIFYTESILEDTKSTISNRDSTIAYLSEQLNEQQSIIKGLEEETKTLKVRLDAMHEPTTASE